MNLIGKRFGEHSQVEVLKLLDERKALKKVYEVRCHLCAQDTEMHGQAVYNVTRALLVKNHIPCGCAKSTKLTQVQAEIQAKRLCIGRQRTFIGFKNGWGGPTSRVRIHCDICKIEWDTCNLVRLRAGHGCPSCATKNRQSDFEYIVPLLKGANPSLHSFLRDTLTKGSDGRARKWSYSCNYCSNDKFVRAGLCNGIFSSYEQHLKQGCKSCRCSPVYKYTREQKELQIADKLVDEPTIGFIGWEGTYTGAAAYATFKCAVHGKWSTRVSSFLDMGSRCPDCAETGYSPSKAGSFYVLTCGDVTKIGITNRHVNERLKEVNKSSGKVFEKVRVFNHCDGQYIQEMEKEFLKLLRATHQNPVESFSGSTECFVGLDAHVLIQEIEQRFYNDID